MIGLQAAAFAILVVILLALVRGFMGPTVFDRVLAVNVVGTKTVLFISVWAFIADRADYLDVALAYALINFIGVVAMLRFYRVAPDTETGPVQ